MKLRSEEGCYHFKPVIEKLHREGRIEDRDRRTWLPPAWFQVGWCVGERGDPRVVYYCPGIDSFQCISTDIVSFLTIPSDRVFTTKADELFFNLFNHRCWYLYLDLKEGVFYARYTK